MIVATKAEGIVAVLSIGAAVIAADAFTKSEARRTREVAERDAALHARDAALHAAYATTGHERSLRQHAEARAMGLQGTVNQLVTERDAAWSQITTLTRERDDAQRAVTAKDGELKKALARIAALEAAGSKTDA